MEVFEQNLKYLLDAAARLAIESGLTEAAFKMESKIAFENGAMQGRSRLGQIVALAEEQPLLGDAVWLTASDALAHQFEMPFDNGRGGRLQARVGLNEGNPADITRQIFYGYHDYQKNNNEMMGLAAYMNTLDPSKAQNAANVIDGGGNGGASIYLIVWSLETFVMAFSPKFGLIGEDGKARCAIVPIDWRFAVRICNIDIQAKEPLNLAVAMEEALLRLPKPPQKHFIAFYMGRAVAQMMDIQTTRLEHPRHFLHIPVRVIGELHSNEPAVTLLNSFNEIKTNRGR